MAYSVSRINTFKSCPNCYKLGYLDNVEKEPPTPALIKGSKTHKAFEMLDESNPIVHNFANSRFSGIYNTIIVPSQKEVKIGIKIDNGKLIPCDFDDESCDFHGIIDVLYKNVILDYKTGKVPEKADWKQLAYYALWLFLASDYDTIIVTYQYVEHDTDKTLELSRSHLPALQLALLRDINMLREYDKNPVETYHVSWKCRFCSVRKHCKRFLDNLLNMR